MPNTYSVEVHEYEFTFSIHARYCAEGYDHTKFLDHTATVKRSGPSREETKERLVREICIARWPGVGQLVPKEVSIR